MNTVRHILLLLVLTATCSLDAVIGQRNGWNIIAGAAGLLTIGALAGGALGYVAGVNSRPLGGLGGYGGLGGLGGYGGYGGYIRGRRSVVEPDLRRRIDDMIDESAVIDESGCAARLLCELHQRPFNKLDDVQRRLVQLFDGKTVPAFDQLSQPKSSFLYAAFVGSSFRKDLKVCSRTFPKCPMNADAILKSLQ